MWNFSKLLVRLATALSVACLSVGAVSAQAQAEPDQPPAVSASPKVTPSATSAASDPASAGYSVKTLNAARSSGRSPRRAVAPQSIAALALNTIVLATPVSLIVR